MISPFVLFSSLVTQLSINLTSSSIMSANCFTLMTNANQGTARNSFDLTMDKAKFFVRKSLRHAWTTSLYSDSALMLKTSPIDPPLRTDS